MGLFDLGSSKSTSSSSSETSASQTTPQTGTLSSGAAIGLGNINVTATRDRANSTANITVNNIQSDQGAINSAFSFGSDVLDLADRVDNRASTANLEFLGKISNFADLSQQTALSMAKMSELQASEAMQRVSDASSKALDLTQAALLKSQSAALDYGSKFAQDAQDASMKALDYVYQSSQSETAKLADKSLMWIVGAAVLVAMIPVLMRMK